MLDNTNKHRTRMRRTNFIKIIAGVIILAVIAIFIAVNTHTASFQRWWKSTKSEYGGGLKRTVTVYDNNGHELREWKGKTDIEENTYGNKVLFELNGKRKVVYNAVVIVEEE